MWKLGGEMVINALGTTAELRQFGGWSRGRLGSVLPRHGHRGRGEQETQYH